MDPLNIFLPFQAMSEGTEFPKQILFTISPMKICVIEDSKRIDSEIILGLDFFQCNDIKLDLNSHFNFAENDQIIDH